MVSLPSLLCGQGMFAERFAEVVLRLLQPAMRPGLSLVCVVWFWDLSVELGVCMYVGTLRHMASLGSWRLEMKHAAKLDNNESTSQTKVYLQNVGVLMLTPAVP